MIRYPKLYKNPTNDKGEYALVMALVMVGNPYPITRSADYNGGSGDCKFLGQPMDKQYDTHFVQIDPDLGYEACDPKRPPKKVMEEIVVKNEAQLLPRYIVFFK